MSSRHCPGCLKLGVALIALFTLFQSWGVLEATTAVAQTSVAPKAPSPLPPATAPDKGLRAGSAGVVPTPFAAIEQAQKAGVVACQPILREMTGMIVDAEHVAISTWSKDAPDRRIFSATNIMKFGNDIAPRAIGVVTAAPTISGSCDGEITRVQPSKLSCDEIAANLAKQNIAAPQVAADIRIYAPNAAGQRVTLLPTATTGCIVVTNGIYFGK